MKTNGEGFRVFKIKKEMSKPDKPMEQASISGFQNLKVKKMLKTGKPMEQVFKILKNEIRIKHKPKTAKEKVKILFTCEDFTK